MRDFFNRILVPGLVIQAVMVGGGYATGRELVEFFLSKGPVTGLLGMAFTAALFSAGTMIAFELARRFQTFDYQSFNRIYLGRLAILFEIGYLATLLLALSVVSAAAARLVGEALGTPELANSIAFTLVVAALVFFGNHFIERIISWWSLLFYLAYGLLCVLVLWRFGDRVTEALASTALDVPVAMREAVAYTGYNIVILPILIFVARHFRSPREALLSGALAGPLILLPGLAFMLALTAFQSEILDAALPVAVVLERLGMPFVSILIQLVILGALVKTGAGLLHGFNERVARRYSDNQRPMSPSLRPLIAVAASAIAVYVAARVGLVDLIGRGYRYSSAYFLLVFLLPLLTRGLWLLLRSPPTADRGPDTLDTRAPG